MPPTPGHGTRADIEAAHMHHCENEPGGPVFALKQELAVMGTKLEAVHTASVELKTTFRTGAWWLATSVSAMAVAVAILAYLATARTGGETTKGESPSIVKTAHAETKGSP